MYSFVGLPKDEELKCNWCDKTFAEPRLLALHKQKDKDHAFYLGVFQCRSLDATVGPPAAEATPPQPQIDVR